MCGICGTIGFSDKHLLKRMTDALRHRGPDGEGFYLDHDAGLGIRRLKVIDLVTGDQPIHNEENTLWVVYNGEIYNFKSLRAGLEAKGHRFYTRSDTEVIVHLYEEHGKDCVRYLEGMFVFALWDKKKKELFIARDRVGIKPLYYHFQDGALRFSSELKSLIEDPAVTRDLDPLSLACFFSFLYIPAPRAIFKGVHKLPAAHTLHFKEGKLKLERYWDLEFPRRELKAVAQAEHIEMIRRGLKDAVAKQLVSDVPLGVFLSGGIDSSAVVAMMREVTAGPIKSFSIGYSDKYSSFNELDDAELVARHFGTEHSTFIVEPKIVDLLESVVWHLDEPFADSSSILNFLISKETRREATVALSGIGGDEVFGGYPRYAGARLSLGYEKLPRWIRRAAAGLGDALIREDLNSQNKGGRIKRFLRGGLLERRRRYIGWMRFFDDPGLAGLLDQDMQKTLSGFDPEQIHSDHFQRAPSADYLDQIFYTDLNTYLVDDLLSMADRMSMAHSLEVRVPFCDYKLIELSA
ncbi:asparagine synthase (glutamine-hydrolyzing), partial [Candidatus Omnitrophota bacterium]